MFYLGSWLPNIIMVNRYNFMTTDSTCMYFVQSSFKIKYVMILNLDVYV